MFILFEGIDGSGKTTQAKLLKKYFDSKGKKTILYSFPSNNWIGKKIRAKALHTNLNPLLDSLLFLTDMFYESETKLKSIVSKYDYVICDRYFPSFMAYQSAQGVDINGFEFIIKEFVKPDLTFIITVDPSVALSRVDSRGETKTKYEKEEFLLKVQNNYLIMKDKFYSKVVLLDGSLSIDKIFDSILREVESR